MYGIFHVTILNLLVELLYDWQIQICCFDWVSWLTSAIACIHLCIFQPGIAMSDLEYIFCYIIFTYFSISASNSYATFIYINTQHAQFLRQISKLACMDTVLSNIFFAGTTFDTEIYYWP